MLMMTTFVLSLLLSALSGCAASGPRPAVPSDAGRQSSTVKPAKHDEGRSMNEESHNAVMER